MANIILSLLVIILIILLVISYYTNMSLKEKRNNLRNEFVSQNKLFLDNIATMVVSLDYNYIVQWSNADSFFENNKYYKYGTKCYKSFGLSSPCKNCPVKEVIETNKEIKIKFDKIPGKLFSVTAIPIAGDKNTARVVLKLDDITEKEKLIKELQSSNELMDLVIDQTPSAMFIKDIDNGFRYVLASDYFCNIIANTPKENVIGHTDFDIFQDKKAAEKFRNDDLYLLRTYKTNNIIDIGEEHIWNNGSKTIVQTKKVIKRLPNNKLYLIGQAIDITEIRTINEKLVIAKEKAEESEKLKMAFLANMSHEIRTPLNAIIGFSELLEFNTTEQERLEYINIIKKNNKLLLNLINDILDLSKIESGTITLNYQEFDIIDVFNDEYLTFKNNCTNPDIKILKEINIKKLNIIQDRNRVLQIVNNFMSNALKYTIKGEIIMGINYLDNGILIYVKDTGIGISKEKQAKLFKRFEKLDSFAQGTGLGLAICKAIAETMKGKIGFESEKGKGTKFWAWIPCKKIED